MRLRTSTSLACSLHTAAWSSFTWSPSSAPIEHGAVSELVKCLPGHRGQGISHLPVFPLEAEVNLRVVDVHSPQHEAGAEHRHLRLPLPCRLLGQAEGPGLLPARVQAPALDLDWEDLPG